VSLHSRCTPSGLSHPSERRDQVVPQHVPGSCRAGVRRPESGVEQAHTDSCRLTVTPASILFTLQTRLATRTEVDRSGFSAPQAFRVSGVRHSIQARGRGMSKRAAQLPFPFRRSPSPMTLATRA